MTGMIWTLCCLVALVAIAFAASVGWDREDGLDRLPRETANMIFGGLFLVSFVLAGLLAIMRLAPK